MLTKGGYWIYYDSIKQGYWGFGLNEGYYPNTVISFSWFIFPIRFYLCLGNCFRIRWDLRK